MPTESPEALRELPLTVAGAGLQLMTGATEDPLTTESETALTVLLQLIWVNEGVTETEAQQLTAKVEVKTGPHGALA